MKPHHEPAPSAHEPAPSASTARPARVGLALLVGFLAFASFAAPAHAGPPVHPPLPDPLNGFALDHACGAANDSQGDIYVSNAGNDAVEVFDPSGTHLATIANSNTPCGLAVDSNGKLYVSEQATGNVVRYDPDAFPLTGSPTYGSPTTIDLSGNAKGISVDPSDDRLYVARGDHVAVYRPDGAFDIVNEVQRVLVGATGGTYTLTFEGQTTVPLAYNAPSVDPGTPGVIDSAQEALEALSTIGAGNVSVTSGGSGFAGDHNITFQGALAATNVPQLTGDESALTGGFGLSISTTTQGFSGRIGDGDLTDATGVVAYTYDPAGPATRYVSVADDSGDLIKLFSGAGIASLALRHTIDGSETPDGDIGFGPGGASLAVDQASGHLFVYDHAHSLVDEFEATGQYFAQIDHADFADAEPTAIAVHPQREEVQRLTINATGGTFTLTFEGDQTASLPYNATADQVEAALEVLPAIGAGNVTVTGGFSPSFGLQPHRIRFAGDLANQNLPQITADSSGLTGGAATATLTTLTQGSGPGRLYVTAGAASGAKLLAFGPVDPPSRRPLPELSFPVGSACGIEVDSAGNIYVAVGSGGIRVYSPTGTLLTQLFGPASVCPLAVDSAGNVYALDEEANFDGDETVELYVPSSFPPTAATTYSGPTTIATTADFDSNEKLIDVSVNPTNGHVLVLNRSSQVIEYDSPANGSAIVNPHFAAGLPIDSEQLAVDGRTGNVYVAGHFTGPGRLWVLNPTGTELLATVTGVGAPSDRVGGHPRIAIDESNGHVASFSTSELALKDFESSGTFLAQIDGFEEVPGGDGGIAIDNSGGPNDGNLYLAWFGQVRAFGRLAYSEPPVARTGLASGIGAGNATLNGTVDPRGFPLTDCHFDYSDEASYQANPLAWQHSVPCAETLAQIGSGAGAVPVHADLTLLDPEGRYHFRLVAANEFGASEGDPALFGPPILTTKTAQPIAYTEATVRAAIDPSGLPTTYRVQYGTQGPCDTSPCSQTPAQSLAAGAGPTDVEVPLFDLAEGTPYHFRLLVANDAKALEGPDQTFTTLARPAAQDCPNAALRTGRSASLPDCRAYELVTPADTRGKRPFDSSPMISGIPTFSNWRVDPGGEQAGNRISFNIEASTLPGFDGNGQLDGYRSQRGEGGWTTELFGPTFQQAGAGTVAISSLSPRGVASDQLYAFWRIRPVDQYQGTLADGSYLLTPAGFEPIGQGALGTDLDADGTFISAGAAHVIFTSAAHLESNAPSAGTTAVYDRSPGGPTKVVSVLPGEVTPGAGQDATYIGATEDGTAVLFEVGGTLYLRTANQTVAVADSPNTFAGVSADGSRVFFIDALESTNPAPHALFVCDLAPGPCTGPGAHAPTQIAANSRFVNVSADGARVYFTSQQHLGDAPLPADLSDKLYVWDYATETIRFIAVLDPLDLDNLAFEGGNINLINWLVAVATSADHGRGSSATRSSPDGGVFVFQSHGNLTPYDAGGHSEIYRYAAADQSLLCISCHPSGAPPGGDAGFWSRNRDSGVRGQTVIANLAGDGDKVFFESDDQLLPEDANDRQDVYQWTAEGAGGCARSGGCLALISGGQSDQPSYLYGVTPDGHDVFFSTLEKLVGQDIANSPSIYDARIGGGIPDPPAPAPCQGDACQGQGSAPPALPSPASGGSGDGNVQEAAPKPRCAKGKRKVRRNGKTRCVKKHSKRKRHHKRSGHRSNPDRRAAR